jgi:hypothetical protein
MSKNMKLLPHALFAGAALVMSLPAHASAQENVPAEGEETAITAEQLADLIEAAIEALPDDATEAEIQAAIAQVILSSNADAATVAAALASISSEYADNEAVVNAVAAVAASGVVTQGGGTGGGSGAPAPPSGGGGGGTSDY